MVRVYHVMQDERTWHALTMQHATGHYVTLYTVAWMPSDSCVNTPTPHDMQPGG